MQQTNNPIVDDVRRIRREVCENLGHNMDRLGAELRRVAREYAAGQGVFASATADAAARVVASWGDMTGPGVPGSSDEVRIIRQRMAHE